MINIRHPSKALQQKQHSPSVHESEAVKLSYTHDLKNIKISHKTWLKFERVTVKLKSSPIIKLTQSGIK